jgi:hypothetical protein
VKPFGSMQAKKNIVKINTAKRFRFISVLVIFDLAFQDGKFYHALRSIFSLFLFT